MTDAEEIDIEALCRRLLMRYATSVDRKDYDRYMSVFAPDCVWRRPGQPPLIGVGQIRTFFDLLEAKRTTAERPRGHLQRHLFTTVDIEVIDENTARSTAYALVFREENPTDEVPCMRHPEVLVQYDDLFRRRESGWLIVDHDISHVFRVSDYKDRLSASEIGTIWTAKASPSDGGA